MKLVSPIASERTIQPRTSFMEDWIETPWNQQRSEAGSHRYVALQPIFNSSRQVLAYEALSRSGWDNQFDGDSDEATRRMIDDWTCHGLTELTRGLCLFSLPLPSPPLLLHRA